MCKNNLKKRKERVKNIKIIIKKRVFFLYICYNICIGDDTNVQKNNGKINRVEK